jgi:hypothetical protein
VKDDISKEKNVVALIVQDKLDDLKPLLPKEDLEELEAFAAEFNQAKRNASVEIEKIQFMLKQELCTRKEFALGMSKELESWQTACIFKLWEQCSIHDIQSWINEYILSHCNKNDKYNALRQTSIFKNVSIWKEIKLEE